jgi:hypothetical protein
MGRDRGGCPLSSAGFQGLVLSRVTDAPRVSDFDIPEDDYFLRVRGIDPDGIEGFNGETRFTVNARPIPPVAAFPTPGSAVRGAMPKISWEAVPVAESYVVEFTAEPNFSVLIEQELKLTGTTYTPTVVSIPGEWYWRAATRDKSGELGPFSLPYHFSLKVMPAKPSTNKPEITKTSVTFSWTEASRGQTYRFHMSTGPTFKEPLSGLKLTEPSLTIPRPEPGPYFVRVAIIGADGFEGAFSKARRVRVWRPK